jgi:hypothetical protein
MIVFKNSRSDTESLAQCPQRSRHPEKLLSPCWKLGVCKKSQTLKFRTLLPNSKVSKVLINFPFSFLFLSKIKIADAHSINVVVTILGLYMHTLNFKAIDHFKIANPSAMNLILKSLENLCLRDKWILKYA